MKRRRFSKNKLKNKVYILLLKNLSIEEIADALAISPTKVIDIIEDILSDIGKEVEGSSIGELLKEYRLCVDGLGEALREAWLVYHATDDELLRLKALRIIIQLYKTKMNALEDGHIAVKVKELIDEYERNTKETTQ